MSLNQFFIVDVFNSYAPAPEQILRNSEVHVSIIMYITSNLSWILKTIDTSLELLSHRGVQFSGIAVMALFNGEIGDESANIYLTSSSTLMPVHRGYVYILNSFNGGKINESNLRIMLGSSVMLDLNGYTLEKAPITLKNYLHKSGYIPSNNRLDILIVPDTSTALKLVNVSSMLYPRAVYLLGRFSNANATAMTYTGRVIPIIRDYYDYLHVKNTIISTLESEAKRNRIDLSIIDLPLLDDKLRSINEAYDQDMTSVIVTQYTLLTLLIVFVINNVRKTLRPVYKREWLLFSSLGVGWSKYTKPLIIASILLTILNFVFVYHAAAQLTDTSLTLHSKISLLIRETPVIYTLIIIIFIIMGIYTVSRVFPRFNYKWTLAFMVSLLMVYLIAYQFAIGIIVKDSLWPIIPALSTIGLLLLTLVVVFSIKSFGQIIKVVTNIWGLALFAIVVLSIFVVPMAQYSSYYGFEEQLVGEFFPGWIHNITLFNDIQCSSIGSMAFKQEYYYFAAKLLVVSIGHYDFIERRMMSAVGPYPAYSIKFIPSRVVFVSRYLGEKMGLSGNDAALYVPAPYRVKRGLVLRLARYNNTVVNVSLGSGEPTDLRHVFNVSGYRLVLKTAPFPFWIDPDRDPSNIPAAIFSRVAVALEPVLVLPLDDYTLTILSRHNQSGVLGIINIHKLSTVFKRLSSEASTLLIISYDLLKNKMRSDLGAQAGRSAGLLAVNSGIIVIVAGITYISEWITERALYKRLLASIGVEDKHVIMLELYGFLLVLGLSIILSSILSYYLLRIYELFLLLILMGVILLVPAIFLIKHIRIGEAHAGDKEHR